MLKLVLIERDASLYASWKGLIRKNNFSELSVEEVVRKYQGFEGDLIAVSEITLASKTLPQTIEDFLKLKKLGVCFLLYVLSGTEQLSASFNGTAHKLGYDIGICAQEEDEIYSSIFHEVLFGTVDELTAFKHSLNENLLFSDRSLAEKYVEVHKQMSEEGKDVEDYMEMLIYEIYGFNISKTND